MVMSKTLGKTPPPPPPGPKYIPSKPSSGYTNSSGGYSSSSGGVGSGGGGGSSGSWPSKPSGPSAAEIAAAAAKAQAYKLWLAKQAQIKEAQMGANKGNIGLDKSSYIKDQQNPGMPKIIDKSIFNTPAAYDGGGGGGYPSSGGSSAGYGGGAYSGGGMPVTGPAAVTTAPAPQVAPPPPVTSGPGAPIAGQSFTKVGSPGTWGSFERQRRNRGPVTGLSITPEMLRRAASQRIG